MLRARMEGTATGITQVRKYPLIGDGWLIGMVDGVFVLHAAREPSDGEFARYLSVVADEIDRASDEDRFGVLYDVVQGASSTPTRRRRLADVLEARREKLARIAVGCAFATSSPVVRGAATALMWLMEPPCDVEFVATTREGFAWLAARLPGLDAERSFRRYAALKQSCTAFMPRPVTT